MMPKNSKNFEDLHPKRIVSEQTKEYFKGEISLLTVNDKRVFKFYFNDSSVKGEGPVVSGEGFVLRKSGDMFCLEIDNPGNPVIG
jgi:hypothetical protein